MIRVRGKLRVELPSGETFESAKGEFEVGGPGVVWSVGPRGGVMRWSDVTSWTTIDLRESRAFRSPRRHCEVSVVADGRRLAIRTSAEQGRELTALATDALPSGAVQRI